MAVYLKPCTGCPLRHGCEQREDFRRRVRGLGLRSATFNCEKLAGALQLGTRVVIRHPIAVEYDTGYGSFGEYKIVHVEVPATITGNGRAEFSCVVDRDALLASTRERDGDDSKIDIYRFRKTMPARRIVRFLNEPRRRLCTQCGNAKLPNGTCDGRREQACENLFDIQPTT